MKALSLLAVPALVLATMAPPTWGQPSTVDVPVNISWVPSMSMGESRTEYPNIRSNFSLNVLAGRSGSLNGLELGGIWSHDAGDVRGVQISGIGNSVRGDLRAVQLAGISNYTGASGKGVQAAGIVNLNRGNLGGAQISGLANLNCCDVSGAQVSGIVNNMDGTLNGVQVAGILNRARHVESGMQVGLINISDSNNGVPVGLISYVKDQGLHGDVWTNEMGFVNLALRSGTATFHNLLTAGYRTDADEALFSLGAGLGIHRDINLNTYLECDLLGQSLFRSEQPEGTTAMSRLRLIAGYRIRSGFSVYAGPVFTSYLSDVDDGSDLAPWKSTSSISGDYHHRSWFGLVAGVRY